MSKNETPIQFGIIGCAEIARKLSRAINLSPNATLYAIASRSIEKAKKKNFAINNNLLSNSLKIYGSYNEILDDPFVDAVYMPFPTSFHLHWAILAAEKKKHLLLEKPTALNVEEWDKIFDACEKNGVQYMDASAWYHHRRTSKMKEMILDPKLFGQVKAAMELHNEDGIVMDILSRLPVRSLLRFRCVSKVWETLISESYFQKKHLSNAKNDFNSQKLLVRQQWHSNRSMFNFYSSALPSDQLVQDIQICPSNCKPFGRAKIYSSCDGLVLLGVVSGTNEQLLIWNPSTRESTELAPPSSEFTLDYPAFGFGYDTNSNGYKILKILYLHSDLFRASVEILTLKSGSWRSICRDPTIVCPKTGCQTDILPHLDRDLLCPVVFVHGAFHWLGQYSNDYSVVSFSTSDEVYRGIPLPEGMYQKANHGISVLGGMLCYYCTRTLHQDPFVTFQLWGMKDYGVVESWTELFTLRAFDVSFAKPKYRYADGEMLLCCRLGRFRAGCSGDDFRTSKGIFGSLWPHCLDQDGIVYTESLISPKLLT